MATENPVDADNLKPVDPVETGAEAPVKDDPDAATVDKAQEAATKSPSGFSRRLDIKGAAVAPVLTGKLRAAEGELAKVAATDDDETDKVVEDPEAAADTAKTAEVLKARGVELTEDRDIGGQPESALLADFLEKNPDVDASKLLEATGSMFKGMTEEEAAAAIAKMTPAEYEEFLAKTAETLAANAAAEKESGAALDASRTLADGTTEDNDFALSGIGADNSNPNWRPSAYTGGVSGRMDVPQVSNAELVSAVEGLANRLTPPADPAALKAVVAVESGGDMGATRYEPHHGHKGRDEATSFGAFQIMGFNAQSLGYASATAMKEAFQTGGVEEQVNAFGKFLETRNLTPHIAANRAQPDFRSFAHGYNGAAYAKLNYHGKMEAAYRRYKSESPTAMS